MWLCRARTLGKGIAFYFFHACGYINVIQFVTIVESIVFYFFHTVGNNDVLELFLATERHLANGCHSLWNVETLSLAHAVNEALLVGSVHGITVKLEAVAVDFLQGEVEY